MASLTIDPTALSTPTSPSVGCSSPSPSSASSAPAPTGPRKRPRSDLSPEEKREARAHRNRIAAQNSRDKRKLQFVGLEQRVNELESENQQLRAAMATHQPNLAMPSTFVSERERAREAENQELRERIKVLEQGWASVVQALSAAGQAIPSLALPPSVTQTNVTPVSQPKSSEGHIPEFTVERAGSPSSISLTNSPSLTTASISASSDSSTRHPARMANTSDSLISVPEVPLPRVETLSTWRPGRVYHPKTKFNRRRRQTLKSTLGCTTFCSPSRLQPHQRRRLLYLLFLKSVWQGRPPSN